MSTPLRKPASISSAQYERMARAGALEQRLELRRGMLIEMPPQHVPHARVRTLLARALERALAATGPNWEVYQETSVDFAEGFQPMPDIVVWDPALASGPLTGPLPGALVKLVVEVADGSLADDLGEKLEDYARAGLAEYWVADVKGGLILRHCAPQEGDYARREPVLFGQPLPWLTQALVIDGAGLGKA